MEILQDSISTEEIMTQIYAENLWGGIGQEFFSGQGSHKAKFVVPYVGMVSQWLDSFGKKLIVCDLGCGDFNIGKQLMGHCHKYIGVDIVEPLIRRNKRLFKGENIEFQNLNLVKDGLPNGDCAILRQVLQHLSNDEIEAIVPKLKKYKYLIITEHLPFGEFVPNLDKPTDADIRLGNRSGVMLTNAPFQLKPIKKEEWFTMDIRNRSRIATHFYQNF